MQLLLILLFGSRRLFNSSLLLSLQKPVARDGVAIFGCGVLGTNICQQILNSKDFAGRTVTGITKSTSRHDSIRDAIGNYESQFNLMTYEEVKNNGERYRDIIFCAPPSGFDDYSGAVRDVAKTILDDGGDDGTMVFTSSGSVYGGLDGQIINERSPLTDTPRAKKLILAENACLEQGKGGIVLRLAGLYSLERGPHKYWLTSGKDVVGREDGIVNLVHYDDAATACIMALLKKKKNTNNDNVFLISDGNPMTRRQICESARRVPLYAHSKIPKFLGTSTDPLGKVYDGSWSNKALNWKPKYVSFDSFMSTQTL